MSFWEDASPAVKGILVVGVIGLLYLVLARVIELPPFSCPEDSSCTGILCSGCEAEEGGQQRGFDQSGAVAPEAEAE